MSDVTIPNLGPFVIVQIAIGAVIVGGALLAWLRGEKNKKPAPEIPEQRWYFDGPITRIINALEGIYREMKEGRREAEDAVRERRDQHKEHMEVVRDLRDRLPFRRR